MATPHSTDTETRIPGYHDPDAEARGRKPRFAQAADIEDAQEVQTHPDMTPEGKEALEAYLANLKNWTQKDPEAKKTFVNEATEVEKSLNQRLSLMATISSEGLLDHDSLRPYKAYVVADRAALAKPDMAEEAYERFQERRDALRDSMGLETLRISAKEYQGLTNRIHIAMKREEHIPLHRDFIAIRKEVAQENAMHPRFVAEIATGAGGSLFDELLVDLDRGDLRTSGKEGDTGNSAWIEDSKIRASLFSEAVAQRDTIEDRNGASRVQKFGQMIAIGKQLIHDPLAIKEFAEQQKAHVGDARRAEYAQGGVIETPAVAAARADGWNQVGGKNYELGMAALENKKFSPEMALAFFQSIDHGTALPKKDRDSIFGTENMFLGYTEADENGLRKALPSSKGIAQFAKDPTLMFRAANAAFRAQFDAGDAKAGMSYSVMEYTATQIMNDPVAIRKIAEVDLDAAQAIEQFRPENRQKLEDFHGGKNFEDNVFQEMQKRGALNQESSAKFEGIQVTKDGEIDLQSALKPKSANMFAVMGENGEIILAASKEGLAAGDSVSFKGPMRNAEGEVLNFEQHGNKGDPIPIYAQIHGEGKDKQIILAARKEDIETGDFATLPDAFVPAGQTGQKHHDQGDGPRSLGKPDQTQMGTIEGMLERQGPFIKVDTGGSIRIAATEADFEAGHSVPFSLYGVKVPPPGKDFATKDDAYDAGRESKSHLEELLQKYGQRGLKITTVDGRDGQKEAMIRLPTGEDVSYRMIRDGYALPSECDTMKSHRESAAEIAGRGNKGLWAHGFPDDDGSWRSESLMPHLTRKDKRENLNRTVTQAMAGTPLRAQRIFSDRSAKLFALDIKAHWEHPSYYREAWEAVQSNPMRMKALYENNVKLMKELRGRKDNLSEAEKVSHDRLTVGARLMGRALVNVGESVDSQTGKKSWKYVTPMDVIKDTEPMMSKRGLSMPQSIKDTLSKGADVAKAATGWGVEQGSALAKYVLGAADDFTR